MPVDYSKIPTEDLEALSKKDYSRVSTNTLSLLSESGGPATNLPTENGSGRMSEVPRAIGETVANIGTQALSLPFHVPSIIQSTYGKYTGESPTATWPGSLSKVGEAITYEPKTQTGKNVQAALGFPFKLLNKGAELAGGITKDITGSPLTATGVDLGIQSLPFLLPGAKKVMGETGIPEKLYTSAIKPSIKEKFSVGKRSEAMRTGVEKGILPTKGGFGLEKLGNKIDSVEGQIDSIIQKGKDTSTPIKTIDIADSLDGLIKMYDQSALPLETYQGIKGVRDKILGQGNYMTVEEAQKFKQNTYKIIRKQYGEMSGAVVEAQKTVARAVKDNIAKQFPEINLLNEKLGPMLKLEDEIQRAVKRVDNRDIISIGLPIKALAAKTITTLGGAGAGYASGHPIAGAIAGLALGVMDTPKVKAALAIALDRAGKLPGAKAVAIGALPYGMNRSEVGSRNILNNEPEQ